MLTFLLSEVLSYIFIVQFNISTPENTDIHTSLCFFVLFFSMFYVFHVTQTAFLIFEILLFNRQKLIIKFLLFSLVRY